MKMQRFFEGKKWLLLIAIVLAGSHARAQGTRDTLILNLDKALEIALSDNPTIKVAEDTALSFKTTSIILVILRKTIIFAHSDAGSTASGVSFYRS